MDGPQALSESLRTEGAQTDPCSQHSAQMWAEAPEAGAHIPAVPPAGAFPWSSLTGCTAGWPGEFSAAALGHRPPPAVA